jgi:hypothetical protein
MRYGSAMRIALLMALAAALSARLSAQAGYEPIDRFQTPSQNIHCEADYNGARRRAEIRCDVLNSIAPPLTAPKDCELDFGQAFALSERGPARLLCAGDTVASDGHRVMPYGAVWNQSGFRCDLTRQRLRCVNRSGHGFDLSTRRQRLF